jgi:hypothetical protein
MAVLLLVALFLVPMLAATYWVNNAVERAGEGLVQQGIFE